MLKIYCQYIADISRKIYQWYIFDDISMRYINDISSIGTKDISSIYLLEKDISVIYHIQIGNICREYIDKLIYRYIMYISMIYYWYIDDISIYQYIIDISVIYYITISLIYRWYIDISSIYSEYVWYIRDISLIYRYINDIFL